MALPSACPLCFKYDSDVHEQHYKHLFQVHSDRKSDDFEMECGRCGRYRISRDLYEDQDGLPAVEFPRSRRQSHYAACLSILNFNSNSIGLM